MFHLYIRIIPCVSCSRLFRFIIWNASRSNKKEISLFNIQPSGDFYSCVFYQKLSCHLTIKGTRPKIRSSIFIRTTFVLVFFFRTVRYMCGIFRKCSTLSNSSFHFFALFFPIECNDDFGPIILLLIYNFLCKVGTNKYINGIDL